MAHLHEYNDADPPRRGTATKIYTALKAAGFAVDGLRYNPNLWGRAAEDGWGTWACEVRGPMNFAGWCGTDRVGVFLRMSRAPYAVWRLPLRYEGGA